MIVIQKIRENYIRLILVFVAAVFFLNAILHYSGKRSNEVLSHRNENTGFDEYPPRTHTVYERCPHSTRGITAHTTVRLVLDQRSGSVFTMDIQNTASAALLRTLIFCAPNVSYSEVVVGNDHSSFFSLYSQKAACNNVSIFFWGQKSLQMYGQMTRLNAEADAIEIVDVSDGSLPDLMTSRLVQMSSTEKDAEAESSGHSRGSTLLWFSVCNVTDVQRLSQLNDAFIALYLQHNLPAVVLHLCNYHPGAHYPTEPFDPVLQRVLTSITKLMVTLLKAGFVAHSATMHRTLSSVELLFLTEQFFSFGKEQGLTEGSSKKNAKRWALGWGGDTLFETLAFLPSDSSIYEHEACSGALNESGTFPLLEHNWISDQFEWA